MARKLWLVCRLPASVEAVLSSGRTQVLLVTAVALALVIFWTSLVTGQVQESDAAENLRAAINLERTGVISDSEAAPFPPSMEREPLPALVGAVAVRIVDGLLGEAVDPSAYFSGERVKLLKYQNMFWLLILSGSVFAAARMLALNFYGSLLCVVLSNLLLLNSEARLYMLDSLYTEAPAAALLTLGSLLLSAGVTQSKLVLTGLAGLLFALLTLVKAAFLYITIGVAAAVVVLPLLQQRSVMVAMQHSSVLCAAFAMVLAPWIFRNYTTFGTLSIAGRGGETLYTRGVMDQMMTMDEYIGGYYYWAPYPLNGALRRILGYSRSDTYRVGGRLQHLNNSPGSEFAAEDFAAREAGEPQNTFTYYFQCSAEHVRLTREMKARGDADPVVSSDRLLMARGFTLMFAHPWKHAALTPLLLWRSAFFTFPALAAAFAWSLRRRKLQLALLTLPALGMVSFYALFSFFTPRYSLPAAPLALCAAAALCVTLLGRLRPSRKR
jgi:hypothetical protein